jgi:hypothetical protein
MPTPAAVASAAKRATVDIRGCELLTQPAMNAEARMRASTHRVVPPYLSPTKPPTRMTIVVKAIVPIRPRRVRLMSLCETNNSVAPATTAAVRCPASAKMRSGAPTAIAARANKSADICDESMRKRSLYQFARAICRPRFNNREVSCSKLTFPSTRTTSPS